MVGEGQGGRGWWRGGWKGCEWEGEMGMGWRMDGEGRERWVKRRVGLGEGEGERGGWRSAHRRHPHTPSVNSPRHLPPPPHPHPPPPPPSSTSTSPNPSLLTQRPSLPLSSLLPLPRFPFSSTSLSPLPPSSTGLDQLKKKKEGKKIRA